MEGLMKIIIGLAVLFLVQLSSAAYADEGVCDGAAKQAVLTELVRLGEEIQVGNGQLEIEKPNLTRLDSSALRIIYTVRVSKVRDPFSVGFTAFRDFEVSLYSGNCGNARVKLLSNVQ
jgi:hypothetical protein